MEPLLSRIASDRSVVVTPRIDNITSTTIAYKELNDNATYGFGWNLYYHLYDIRMLKKFPYERLKKDRIYHSDHLYVGSPYPNEKSFEIMVI